MKQKIYWDNVADIKEFSTPFQSSEFSKYAKTDGLILDVGCGYGRTLEQLYQAGYQNLIGIDFSEKMIERGKAQYSHLDLRVMPSKKIDLPAESCDAVILFAVLTCIIDKTEQQNMIDEIVRVLKPNGIIYVNDFLLNTDERNIHRYNEFKGKYDYGVFELPEGAVVRHHDKFWIEKLLSPFKKNIFEELVFTTMNGNKSNGFFYIGRK